jgi:hypothetical protein
MIHDDGGHGDIGNIQDIDLIEIIYQVSLVRQSLEAEPVILS